MNKPLVQNAADEEQLGKAKDKLGHVRNQERNDWLFVMGSDQGFRVLTQIMRFSKMEECPMGGNDRDVFYRIGRQELGKYVKAQMILADRKKYFEMEMKLGEQK